MITQHIHPADERPLRRIGFPSEWEIMNWYVQKVAQENVDKMNPKQLRYLQEEMIAWERTVFRHDNIRIPDVKEIRKFQVRVLKHLTDLVDLDSTFFGPWKDVGIHMKREKGKSGEKRGWSFHIGPVGRDALIYHMAQLLDRYKESIKRCEYCQKIFLQFRKSARHCGRVCQSRAIMRKIRPPKGGSLHGTKRR